MCRIDETERPTVSTTFSFTARKQHKCCECNRTISPGEKYLSTKNLYEGHWDTFRTCSHCAVAQRWLAENCGGWVFEQVGEEIEEHADEYPALAPGLLAVADGIKRRWTDGSGLMPIPEMPASIQSTLVDA